MAKDTEAGAGEKKAAAPKKESAPKASKKKGEAVAMATDEAPKASIGKPRLQVFYETIARARLAKQFGFKNPHQVPRITKIVLNVGMGDGAKNPRLVDAAAEELAIITGQKAVITKAKKAIANFGLRAGMPVGASVTLRNARMYEFLDRFINVALPRVRDFRGLPLKCFDGRGNLTVGIKEQLIFPEIDFDKVENIHGMDITVVTTASRDDLSLALMREFGWPFRGELPVKVA